VILMPQILDLSYNRLSFLGGHIGHLTRLESLNLQGNRLASLPSGWR